jgi:hypothetical protein
LLLEMGQGAKIPGISIVIIVIVTVTTTTTTAK